MVDGRGGSIPGEDFVAPDLRTRPDGQAISANFDPKMHHRRSIRLKGYDYSRVGAYFVTIVAARRQCLFGEVVDGEMRLNAAGLIVEHAWFDLPRHYPHAELGAFAIMPNHVHGIIVLNAAAAIDAQAGSAEIPKCSRGGSIPGEDALPGKAMAGEDLAAPDSKTRPYAVPKRQALPEIVRAFKSFSALRINLLRHTHGTSVWQRNYYEHIIRNERELDRIWRYIHANALTWAQDDENPARTKPAAIAR